MAVSHRQWEASTMEHPRANSLTALLEAEKAELMAGLGGDRSPAAAQALMEKAVDKINYRYVEACGDAQIAAAAQASLAGIKSTLSLIAAVNDSREWKRSASGGEKRGLSGLTLGMLVGGAVLIAAGVLGLYFSSGRFGAVLGLVRALIPALGGGALIWFAGKRAAKPAKADDPRADVRKEFLVDPESAYHALHGAMVVADGELDRMAEEAAVAKLSERNPAALGPLSSAEAELMSNLLETAYARPDDADSAEMISEIRFYLHGKGVELVDYDASRTAMFEMLPAPERRTLRPAIVQDGRVLKKGLASGSGIDSI